MKKLYISVLGLFITIMFFTTIAYAWISLATINTIENISLSTISDTKLEISLDGINYYESIPKSVIEASIKKITFADVTSSNGKDFYKNYKNLMPAVANKDYLSLEFHFRTNTMYTEVHLSDNVINVLDYDNPPISGTYITSKGLMWEADTSFLYDEELYVLEGEVNKFYAKDAMRVAFVNKNDESNETKIFDLSGNEQRGFGKPYGAIAYLNKMNNENNVAPNAPNTIYELSTFSSTDPIALTHDSRIITLMKSSEQNGNNESFYKGSVVMNVWLEGWDADAFDAIHKDQLKMQFTFKAVLPEGTLDD